MKCPHCGKEINAEVDYSYLVQRVNVDGVCYHVEEIMPIPMSKQAKTYFYNHRYRTAQRPPLVIVREKERTQKRKGRRNERIRSSR